MTTPRQANVANSKMASERSRALICICMCTITRALNRMTAKANTSHSAACGCMLVRLLFGVTRHFLTYYDTLWRNHRVVIPDKLNALYNFEPRIFLVLMPLLRPVQPLRRGGESFQKYLGVMWEYGDQTTRDVCVHHDPWMVHLGATGFSSKMANWCQHVRFGRRFGALFVRGNLRAS
jgi:hypothetical protein